MYYFSQNCTNDGLANFNRIFLRLDILIIKKKKNTSSIPFESCSSEICGKFKKKSLKLLYSLDETKTGVLVWLQGALRCFCMISEVNLDGWKIDGCQMQCDIDSGSCSWARFH